MGTTHQIRRVSAVRTGVLLIMLGSAMFALSGCASSRDMLSRMHIWKRDEAAVAANKPAFKNPLINPLSKGTTGPKAEVAQKSLTPRPKSTAQASAESAAEKDEGDEIRRVSESTDDPPASERRAFENPLFRRTAAKQDPFLKQDAETSKSASANAPATRTAKTAEPGAKPQVAAAKPAASVEKTESTAETRARVDRYKSLFDSLPKEGETSPDAVEAATETAAKTEDSNPFAGEEPVVAAAARQQDAGNPFAESAYEELSPPDDSLPAGDAFAAATPAQPDAPFGVSNPTETTMPAAAPAPAAKTVGTVETDTATRRARLHADALMLRARLAIKQDRSLDALRLARAAETIEVENALAYEPHEERPSDFVKRIEQRQHTPTVAAPIVIEPATSPQETAPVGAPTITPAGAPNPFAEQSAGSAVTPAEVRSTIPADEAQGSVKPGDDFYHYQPRDERPMEIRPNGFIENTSFETVAGSGSSPLPAAAPAELSREVEVTANVPQAVEVADGPSFGGREPADSSEVSSTPAKPVSGPQLIPSQSAGPVRYSDWAAAPAPWANEAPPEAKPAGYSAPTILAIAVVALGLCGFGVWVRLQRRHYATGAMSVHTPDP